MYKYTSLHPRIEYNSSMKRYKILTNITTGVKKHYAKLKKVTYSSIDMA